MTRIISIVFAAVLLQFNLSAQDKQTKPTTPDADKWNKPYDLRYYDLLGGYTTGAGPVYDISAACFWGRARGSLLDFVINRKPRHKFQVRDIIDVQLGVGYGDRFYANIVWAGGLKFKYDLSPKIDFGCNISYRMAIDRIAYIAPMIHGFARFDKIFVEVGTGGNGDTPPTSKQRKMTNVNVKYYFNPKARIKYSLNATYWSIHGRNNQVNNDWETVGQYMIGLGIQ